MAEERTEIRREGWPQRCRRAALFVLFALVLLIPKTLGLRRRPRIWNAIRVGLALIGAALVVAPMGGAWSWFAAPIGLALFFVALLATPAKQQKSLDEQARELGALVVVNGGRFQRAGDGRVPARLYVAPERVFALDLQHVPLVEIPLGAVSSVRAEEAGDGWKLRVVWDQTAAEFSYDGFFAEHLARVAENTLRSLLQRELPVLK
jgi:hypothetical protein